jgi:membrane dipeptidase
MRHVQIRLAGSPQRSTVRAWVMGLALGPALWLSGLAWAEEVQTPKDGPRVTAAVRRLHESLLTLDSHLDTPARLPVRGWDIVQRHDRQRDGSQVDWPRMVEGGLDGGFWAIYTGQGPNTAEGAQAARDAAFSRLLAIREMVAAQSSRFGLAWRADDAQTLVDAGRRVVFLSIENAYPLQDDVTLLRTFHHLGVRLAGLVHMSNNTLADSSTDPQGPRWQGLSPSGREFVALANRLGVVLDGSHASDQVLDQLIDTSATPVLLSHSGLKAVFDHPRNIDDDRLRHLAARGGVIQINFLSDYLIATPRIAERQQALDALWADVRKIRTPTVDDQQAWTARKAEIDRRWPVPRATFEDAFAHLLHAVQVVGVDHVGIGADFDGGGGVLGFEDARDYPKITARLLQEGYSRADIQKIWSGNLLRVLRAAEDHARVLATTASNSGGTSGSTPGSTR